MGFSFQLAHQRPKGIALGKCIGVCLDARRDVAVLDEQADLHGSIRVATNLQPNRPT